MTAPEPVRADLLGGEITLILDCLEVSRGFRRQLTTPFEAHGCPRDPLHQIELHPPPGAVSITPECDHHLVHLTSQDFRFNEVAKLSEAGRFTFTASFLTPINSLPESTELYDSGSQPCFTVFDLDLSGTVECVELTSAGVGSVAVHTSWTEKAGSRTGSCPTTAPCQFVTATELRCI
jgi:hypothetical protein